MLDRWSLKFISPPLVYCAKQLNKKGITANHVTLTGFIVGLLCIPLLYMQAYYSALAVILLNRIFDGIDGQLARLSKPTDAGAYLDICLDFLFYSAVVFGFALSAPDQNGLAASALIFSFVGTGSSFLAFAIFAERRKKASLIYPNKGFYYLAGLAEGTETILIFCLFCLFPQVFPVLAWSFAAICFLSTILRITGGYRVLYKISSQAE